MGRLAPTPATQRLDVCRALAHPLRARLFDTLVTGVHSPTELAQAHDASLQSVSYHVHVLVDLGCAELVGQVQRRGAVEHRYRATVRVHVEVEQLAQ
jgi:DNA-binding transcriptional ArsR family regulator